MATRSKIAIENADGTVTAVYCHWDGYPEGNGMILAEHYRHREKVQQLIDLGSISSLQEFVFPEGEVVGNNPTAPSLWFTLIEGTPNLIVGI